MRITVFAATTGFIIRLDSTDRQVTQMVQYSIAADRDGGAVYWVQIVLSRDHGDSLANGVTGLFPGGTGKRQSHPMTAAIWNIDKTEHAAPIFASLMSVGGSCDCMRRHDLQLLH